MPAGTSPKEKPRRSAVSGVLRDAGESFRGGADGDRTHDLHDANVALSQLSYRPTEAGDISSAYRFSPRVPDAVGVIRGMFSQVAGWRGDRAVRHGANHRAGRAIRR